MRLFDVLARRARTRLGRAAPRAAAALPAQPAAPAAQADPGAEAIAAREERLAERFLEDEALRGNLDGATWQPLQEWLLAAVHRLADSTRGLDDAAAEPLLERGSAALRREARARVARLEAGER